MTPRRFGRLTDPKATFLVVGARVVDPAAGTDAVRDVAVVDGMVVPAPAPGSERIDGRGLVVAPGLCELHCHLREPGTEGETIQSGCRAAAHGGFTTVCAMPNTDPPLDAPDAVAAVLERAGEAACRVRVIGAATLGRRGERPSDLAALAEAGVIGFSDDGAGIAAEPVAEEILHQLATLRLPLVEHAEDASLAGAGVMRAGPTATRLGLPGWPAGAELVMVERDLRLAEAAGARIHLTHLSTAASVEAVRRARAGGASVTCDVTPHHLALTDAWVAGSRRFSWEDPGADDEARAYDGAVRVNPPLPSREDALALLAAVEDGTIDAIATDHAPHPPHRKLVPFAEAAPGLTGLETALSLGLAAVEAGRLSLGRLLAALSSGPAGIIGERRGLAVGEPAELVLFDPGARWRVRTDALESGSSNTPLLDMELPGVVRLTVADGRVTYRS